VAHAREPFQQAVDDFARGASGCIGKEADAAGVAFATEAVDWLHYVRPSSSVNFPPAVAT
jgi:hypothetical protein